MIDDYTMVVHHIPDAIDIIAVGDVHLGAIEHEEDKWEAFLDSVKNEPNTYICLLGDLLNNSLRSAVANPFDEVIRPMTQKQKMTEYLEPIADKILCAVSGNHEYRTKGGKAGSDQDLTYDIMCKLGIEDRYRENTAYVKLALGLRASSGEAQTSYIIAVTHGAAGGRLTGNTINRAEEYALISEGIDALIVGHAHKGAVTRPLKLVCDARANKVYKKEITIVCAESWMTYGGYAMRKMLKPAEASNPQRLHLTNSKDHKRIGITWN